MQCNQRDTCPYDTEEQRIYTLQHLLGRDCHLALDDAVAAFNRTERIRGKTIIRVNP